MRWGNLEVAVFTKERQVNPQVGQWERLPPILSSMVPIHLYLESIQSSE